MLKADSNIRLYRQHRAFHNLTYFLSKIKEITVLKTVISFLLSHRPIKSQPVSQKGNKECELGVVSFALQNVMIDRSLQNVHTEYGYPTVTIQPQITSKIQTQISSAHT